jgi:SAM-dependent methyltransferase
MKRVARVLRRAVPDAVKRAVIGAARRVAPGAAATLIGIAHAAGRERIDATDTAAMRAFVERTEALGGPESEAAQAWWRTLAFRVPAALRAEAARTDPLSDAYLALQDRLYQAIRGAPYEDTTSELTQFDRQQAIEGHLAYSHLTPKGLNKNLRAMTRMVDEFDRDGKLRILEAGSGWGFSCEYLARLGHAVVGVDISPDFIAAASARSARQGLGIDYRLGRFDALPLAPDERFDIVFTSAALHHTRHPERAVRAMADALAPDGQLILAAEPFIAAEMWPHWGLRLDPLSLYCVARFGWWESGWTRPFMERLFARADLAAQFIDHHSDLEHYLIGRRIGSGGDA